MSENLGDFYEEIISGNISFGKHFCYGTGLLFIIAKTCSTYASPHLITRENNMKKILFLFFMFTSVFAFANLNSFVGNYSSRIGNGEATVSKVLVTPANLFEPAIYEYVLHLSNDRDGLYLKSETLVPSKNGKILSLSTFSECDDPGCTYFDSIDVILSTIAGKAFLEVEYHGYQDLEEEENRSREFSKKIKYIKN